MKGAQEILKKICPVFRPVPRAVANLKQRWNSGKGVLSTQVLQELCINLRRRVSRPLPVDEVRLLMQDYLAWEIVTNTPDSVLQALDIEKRYKTSFWDALILHAAESQEQLPSTPKTLQEESVMGLFGWQTHSSILLAAEPALKYLLV